MDDDREGLVTIEEGLLRGYALPIRDADPGADAALTITRSPSWSVA